MELDVVLSSAMLIAVRGSSLMFITPSLWNEPLKELHEKEHSKLLLKYTCIKKFFSPLKPSFSFPHFGSQLCAFKISYLDPFFISNVISVVFAFHFLLFFCIVWFWRRRLWLAPSPKL